MILAERAQRATMLKRRLLSALILGPIVVVLTWVGSWPFALMVALAGMVMVYEWSRVIDGAGLTRDSLLHGLVVLVVAGLTLAHYPLLALAAVLFGTMATVGFATERRHAAQWPLLGTPYVALPVLSLIWLRQDDPFGARHVIWLLGVVWATDSAAYFSGRALGGPKLAPGISPNKTWAGLIGGVAAAGIWGLAVSIMIEGPASLPLVGLSAALGAWSQVGDLAESALKRRFHLKDSGAIIPGHGGLLDRVDGLLFAAPVAALWLVLCGEGALP